MSNPLNSFMFVVFQMVRTHQNLGSQANWQANAGKQKGVFLFHKQVGLVYIFSSVRCKCVKKRVPDEYFPVNLKFRVNCKWL